MGEDSSFNLDLGDDSAELSDLYWSVISPLLVPINIFLNLIL